MEPDQSVIVDDSPTPKKKTEAPKDHVAAKGRPFWHFLGRTLLVTFRPRAFWRRLAESGAPSFGELIWPHTTILSALGGIAAMVGGIARERPMDIIVAHSLLTFAGSVIMVLAFGFVARIIAGAERGSAKFAESFAFGVYGMTPMLILGVLHVVPSPLVHSIVGLLALPYAFFVISLGVRPMLAIPNERAAEATGLLTAAALLSWTLTSALAAIPVAGETPQPVVPTPALTVFELGPADALPTPLFTADTPRFT